MISLDTVLKDFHSIVVDDGGASLTVDAADLDIRDLAHTQDSVKIGDGTDFLAIAADGSIAVTDNGGSLTVDGTVELGATTLAALETITVEQGTSPWVIGDGGGSITVDGSVSVSATDLDIRDLTHVSDSVKIGDGTDFLAVAADGSIAVTDNGGSLTVDGSVSVSNLNMYAEDTAHVSGDMGMMPLAVRKDSATSLADTDGDYAPLQLNSSGRLRTSSSAEQTVGLALSNAMQVGGNDGSVVRAMKVDAAGQVYVIASDFDIRDLTHVSDSVKIGDGTDFLSINGDGSINAQFTEAGYSSWSVVTASVGVVESQLVASPLSNRLRVEIQNLGDKDVYIRQATGVTSANGFKIPKGSSWEMSLDAGAAIYAIASGASADLRIAQYAA